jgi:hypothetical protein
MSGKSETERRAAEVLAPHWPETLKSRQLYERPCDDKRYGRLTLSFSEDGDAWVTVHEGEREDLSDFHTATVRIRTLFGGGRSIRTRQALLWLAEAMRQDEAEYPIHRLSPGPSDAD